MRVESIEHTLNEGTAGTLKSDDGSRRILSASTPAFSGQAKLHVGDQIRVAPGRLSPNR